MAKVTTPIWRDIYVDLGVASAIPFRVRANSIAGDIIYQGRCNPLPGGGNCTVRINDIAADYLTHTVPTLGAAAFSALTFPMNFYVETYSGGLWSLLSDWYEVLMDWSFNPAYDVNVDGLSFPIDGALSPLQYVLFTAYDVADVTATFTYTDGTTDTQTISLSVTADFDASFNHDFARSLRASGSGTAAFRLADYENGKTIKSVNINGVDFDVLNDCDYRYVLYYLNQYGGWDSLLVRGISTRADALERSTVDYDYDNRGVMNRGRKDYAVDITRKYTLRTHLLTDAQAERMPNLLESTDVYLHDTLTGEIRPAVLTGNDVAFQSFRGNGGAFPQYTIEAEIAQEFERR